MQDEDYLILLEICEIYFQEHGPSVCRSVQAQQELLNPLREMVRHGATDEYEPF